MFHRAPRSISATAVATTCCLSSSSLAVLFALSPPLRSALRLCVTLRSARGQHNQNITPEIGEEDRDLTVTLQLSRPLTEDENYCYSGRTHDGNGNRNPTSEVCIEGGIYVWDNYDDHRNKDEFNPTDQLVKFVFRGGQEKDRLTVSVEDDSCITPDREIRIAINWAFDDTNIYGYNIDRTEYTVRISGDDEMNGALVADGGKGSAWTQAMAPLRRSLRIRRRHSSGRDKSPFSVARRHRSADEEIGSPVTATDPDEDDTLDLLADRHRRRRPSTSTLPPAR